MVARGATGSLLALLLVACGGEQKSATLGGAESPEAFCLEVEARVGDFLDGFTPVTGGDLGGTVVVAAAAELAGGLNHFVTQDAWSRWVQVFANLTTLVRRDQAFGYEAYLADSWEVSEDSTRLTFHLRDDVFWHDGVRTSAYDVAFTFRVASNPDSGYPNSGYWPFYGNGPQAVQVIDSFTVSFEFQPHMDFLDTWTNVAIMPEHLLGDVPLSELAQHPYGQRCPVGNGPFRFVEHREGDRWIFEYNPAFPEGLGGRPLIDRLVYRIIPEPATRLAEVASGGADFYPSVPPGQLQALAGMPDVDIQSFPSREVTFVAWNGRRAQLADKRVRRALTLALDRQQLVEVFLQGHGVVANSTVTPVHWAYDTSSQSALLSDPAQARLLLDEAGWVDGDGDGVRENEDGLALSFSLMTNFGSQERSELQDIIRAAFRAVGVDANLETEEWGASIARAANPQVRDFDAVLLSFTADWRMDDAALFHSESGDREPIALAGLQDELLDSLLLEMRFARDPVRDGGIWRRYEERLIELQPFTFLYHKDGLSAVGPRLRGVRSDARGDLANITEWWIPAESRRQTGGAGP